MDGGKSSSYSQKQVFLQISYKVYNMADVIKDEIVLNDDELMKDDLSKEDIKKLKVVAKDLLEKIKAQLATMDHPFDKQETRASIIITIRDVLWKELPESYSDESINYYRDAVYNYVSQHYGSVA